MMNEITAVITGGAGGIGFATAELLAKAGATVVIADANVEQGQLAEQRLRAIQEGCRFFEADVTDLESVRRLMDYASQLGTLNVLFNNAGVLAGNRFPDSDPHAWRLAVDVNIIGTMNCVHAAVPHLRKQPRSTILNMGSTAGLKASYLDPAYALTKAAIVNLTRSLTFLRDESGISINCLCPALVKTDLAKNSSSNFSVEEAALFTERRGNRNERPSLSVDAVAQAAVKLIHSDDLNGYCCEMTLENPWNLIPPVLPQKV